MNYKVIAARFKKSFVRRKTTFLVTVLLLTSGGSFAQSTITDIDGNVYNTVVIGNQVWMKENLKTSRYNDGTLIPTGLSNVSWDFTTSGACADYNNDPLNTAVYGKLYNWYAVANPAGLCPIGWHEPEISDWSKLILQVDPLSDTSALRLGGIISYVAGMYLKESGNSHWINNQVNVSNSSGFTAIPSGTRDLSGYMLLGDYNILACVTRPNSSWYAHLELGRSWDVRCNATSGPTLGLSVRCIRDLPFSCGTGAITPDGPTTFCAGNSVNLKSDVVGGTYQWKKNGVNITANGTSRTYKATATGSYTCVATCNGTTLTSNAIQVTTKTNAAASVTASGATSFCLGDSVTLNCTNLGSNYSVQWYRTNISMENATNYSTVVKQPGTYKVVTRNLTNGCSRISGSAITTSVNCRIAGDITSGTTEEETTTNEARLIDNELSQGVHIYPNPNNGSFNFTYDGEETGDGILQIINTMGQSIYNSAVIVQEGGYTQEIQLGDNYTKGIYIVRFLINGSYHDSRVMVR